MHGYAIARLAGVRSTYALVLLTNKLSPIPSKLLKVLTITIVSLSPLSLAILFASLKSI